MNRLATVATRPTPAPAGSPLAAQTRLLVEAPIVPTLLWLAAPNVAVMASQGAGRLLWPLVAGFARLFVAATGGWIAIHWFGYGLPGLFAAIAAALAVYGTTVAVAVKAGAWR